MASPVCFGIKGDGTRCTHPTKQEYGNRYCGTHRSQWQQDVIREELRSKVGYHCGIGFDNLAITFIRNDAISHNDDGGDDSTNSDEVRDIVSYIGSVDEMMRLDGSKKDFVELLKTYRKKHQ